MRSVFVLLVFASIGALLTMLLLPPIPRLRTYRIYPYASSSSRLKADWDMVPIPGHATPSHIQPKDTNQKGR